MLPCCIICCMCLSRDFGFGCLQFHTHYICVKNSTILQGKEQTDSQSSPFQSTQICQKPANTLDLSSQSALICFSCDRYWSSVSKIRKDPVKYHLSVTQTVHRSTRLTEMLSDYLIFCKSKQGCDQSTSGTTLQ